MTDISTAKACPVFNSLIISQPARLVRTENAPKSLELTSQPWRSTLTALIESNPALSPLLARYPTLSLEAIIEPSPFMRNLVLNQPERLIDQLVDLSESAFQQKMQVWREVFYAAKSEAELMQSLRQAKQTLALFLGLADLAALWPVMALTKALSDFAELALEASATFLLNELARRGHYKPKNPNKPLEGSGLIILAMGKMGAFELNFSSDIDLMIFFDPARPELKDPDEVASLFVGLVRRLVKLLQARTSDGYVFRTDLRLRPDPGSTSVAISTDAALAYYESFGQPWERAALIKARIVASDRAAAVPFLNDLSPFIWRRYVDASVLLEVRRLRQRMEIHKHVETETLWGRNIKLGRGGIRDIEFLVQTKQLMLGGRHPSLRCRSTLDAILELERLNHITPEARLNLGESYLILRNLEHKIQMLRDEQSHTLPPEHEMSMFAAFSGFESVEALQHTMDQVTKVVQDAYDRFFFQLEQSQSDNDRTSGAPSLDSDQILKDAGFTNSDVAHTLLKDWQSGRYPALRSDTAQSALQSALPHLLSTLVKTGEPEAGLIAFDQFLRGLPIGVQLFSLFHASPALLTLLVRILATAPRLADIIRRRPHVFDGLLDLPHNNHDSLPDAHSLDIRLRTAKTDEEQLDILRIFVKERQFLLGAHVLGGLVPPSQIASGFTKTAEIAIQAALELSKSWMSQRHGTFPDQSLVVLALGRLGAADMTAHSDLDLILIYDCHDATLMSEGQNTIKPLMPAPYFTKLTQRMITLLSAPTAEGMAYELDFRLRPSGHAGPLATRLSAFEHYQETEAWLWEHMALTRARVIVGNSPLKTRVESLIRQTIQAKRPSETVHQTIVDMRQRIEKEKPARSHFDLKYARGGLVDLEFLTQAMFLTGGIGWHPPTLKQGEEGLETACEKGLVTTEIRDYLLSGWDLQKRLNQILRLLVVAQFDREHAEAGTIDLITELMGFSSFDQLENELIESQRKISHFFNQYLKTPTA